jgi:DNA-binding LytR/AlgR family response regulator
MKRLVSILIVEDDLDSALLIQQLLDKCLLEARVVGIAQNARQALYLIEAHAPDILLLDIHMSDSTGLALLAQLDYSPKVIFVTADPDFAIQAFDMDAVDYLLKPIRMTRLKRALEKALQGIQMNIGQNPVHAAVAVANPPSPEGEGCVKWFRAAKGNETVLVHTDSVVVFISMQKYTTIVTQSYQALIRSTMIEIESKLDPQKFIRISRSCIVNMTFIQSVRKTAMKHMELVVQGLSQPIRVSKSQEHLFKQD